MFESGTQELDNNHKFGGVNIERSSEEGRGGGKGGGCWAMSPFPDHLEDLQGSVERCSL